MKPPIKKLEYEKINTSDFVTGSIEDVLYDQEHVFKGYGKDSDGNPKPDTVGPAVRLVFTVDGYKFPHKTPWMKFSYSEKSNLYKKFVSALVKDAKEFMDWDLDQLKGMKVKMLWADKGEFQNLETIRPIGDKIVPVETPAGTEIVPF